MRLKIKVLSATGDALKAKLKAKMQRAVADAGPKIAALLIDDLSREADRALGPTADEYKRGIQNAEAIEVTETSITIRPTTPFARSLEMGFSAFDIKAHLLRNAKKTTKDGEPYMDVPFQHGLSATSARLHGMPAEVRSRVENELKGKVNRLQGRTQGALKSHTLHVGQGKQVKYQTHHERGIHDNLVRIKTGRKSEYKTFRRVSGNSNPGAWWHPGFPGVKLFEKAAERLTRPIHQIFADSLRAQGLKVKT